MWFDVDFQRGNCRVCPYLLSKSLHVDGTYSEFPERLGSYNRQFHLPCLRGKDPFAPCRVGGWVDGCPLVVSVLWSRLNHQIQKNDCR